MEHVRLQDGRQSGQVRLDFARRKGTVMYEYEYRTRGEENWSPHFSTTSSRGNVIAPLPVAQFCEVRVRGINSKGAGDWSDIATILVR